jgi:3alpha(or 20beta)-hydroxysteroid dehydrogenase
MGTADDVAAMIAFLASDDSSYSTGAEFVIDGGASATAGF